MSRVSLYAHFPAHPQLLKALSERVVSSGAEAIAAATAGSGEPAEALDKPSEAAWGKLDRNLRPSTVGRGAHAAAGRSTRPSPTSDALTAVTSTIHSAFRSQ